MCARTAFAESVPFQKIGYSYSDISRVFTVRLISVVIVIVVAVVVVVVVVVAVVIIAC